MHSASFPARQARSQYRHELRTLTYVTLDDGNGGVIRNLSHEGVAVQAVGRLQPERRVRLRFELRFPRLWVEAHGVVSWANSSGQCGVQFVDLSASTRDQIDEWIFSNLLDSLSREAANQPIFGASVVSIAPEENDGLILSAARRTPIRLGPSPGAPAEPVSIQRGMEDSAAPGYAPALSTAPQLNWLSRPLSARTLAWMVDSLVMIAALLLFAVVFLAIAHEVPQWQLTLGGSLAAAALVALAYWILFATFGGSSLGTRVSRAASEVGAEKESEGANRFR
jgi:PilZ domain